MLDLVYNEDSQASADMNLVMTETGRIVEIQATAERMPFSSEEFNKMFSAAQTEIKQIIKLQKEFLK